MQEAFFCVVCEHCNKMLAWKEDQQVARNIMIEHHNTLLHTVTMLASFETLVWVSQEDLDKH